MNGISRLNGSRGSGTQRRIDHIIGSPALYLLGAIRRRKPEPTATRTIGLISCATIGDTIIGSAVARDIQHILPDSHVVVFAAPACKGISRLVTGFDEEISLPVTNPRRALATLRDHPMDVLIDLSPWPRITALLAGLASPGFTIGFRTPGTHRHFAFDVAVEHSPLCHEVDNFRRLLNPLGIVGKNIPRAAPALRNIALEQGAQSRTIVFHPWASGYRSELREWRQDNWVQLARMLIDLGYDVTITGGPSDRSRARSLAESIGAGERICVLAGAASLMETAESIARATAVVSVNTGIMHVAAALDRPMVALHGPTNPRRWGPLSASAIVVGPGSDRGGGYLHLGFEYPPNPPDCMGQITVGEVFACLTNICSNRLDNRFPTQRSANTLMRVDSPS